MVEGLFPDDPSPHDEWLSRKIKAETMREIADMLASVITNMKTESRWWNRYEYLLKVIDQRIKEIESGADRKK